MHKTSVPPREKRLGGYVKSAKGDPSLSSFSCLVPLFLMNLLQPTLGGPRRIAPEVEAFLLDGYALGDPAPKSDISLLCSLVSSTLRLQQ